MLLIVCQVAEDSVSLSCFGPNSVVTLLLAVVVGGTIQMLSLQTKWVSARLYNL